MKRWFVPICIVAAACADGVAPAPDVVRLAAPVDSPAEVWLTVGQEVRVDSVLRLGFAAVVGDSRCPATVQCVWAGDGEARMWAGVGSHPPSPFVLHTTQGARSFDVGGYRVTLLNLSPYPQVPGPIPADAYAIQLRVERRVDLLAARVAAP